MKNIQVVDTIVNQTEELFRQFYQDDDTAFIFTSDHGMTSIGNHGDGRKPRPSSDPPSDSHARVVSL